MLTAQDIREKEFTKAVRGYSVEEVDAFLDQLCADYERNLEETERLNLHVAALQEQVEKYKAQEGAMLNTLETAKSLMSDISASAEKRAGILLKNAELDADLKQRKASEAVDRLRTEEALLNKKVSNIRSRLKSVLEAELKHIDDMSDDLMNDFSVYDIVKNDSYKTVSKAADSSLSKTDPFLKQLENDFQSEPEDLLGGDDDLTKTRIKYRD
ncbi:MAG: DivIVA domain-containing protein [Firmicutes bacterium]|nr:DivIVA domain-containing protein [Bacillota bacterium]